MLEQERAERKYLIESFTHKPDEPEVEVDWNKIGTGHMTWGERRRQLEKQARKEFDVAQEKLNANQ